MPLDFAADLHSGSARRTTRPECLGCPMDATRSEVRALLAYAEDVARGLINPHFVRLRPEFSIDEAIRYLRIHVRDFAQPISDAYVLDAEQRLLGVVSPLDLFSSPANQTIDCVMTRDPITVTEDADQEFVSQVFREYDLLSVPVVDGFGRMKGVVTVDDIVDVLSEEATEDVQKIAGAGPLPAPYLPKELLIYGAQQGWLVSAAVFRGDADSDGDELVLRTNSRASIVLVLFLLRIISIGGNAGSQATTLVVRAVALGEVKLRDWWKVVRREFDCRPCTWCHAGRVSVP